MKSKKKTSKKVEPKEEPKEEALPQITFTESELEDLVKYMNFMQTKTDGKVRLDEMKEYNRLTRLMVEHINKCESHILEIKRVTRQK